MNALTPSPPQKRKKLVNMRKSHKQLNGYTGIFLKYVSCDSHNFIDEKVTVRSIDFRYFQNLRNRTVL